MQKGTSSMKQNCTLYFMILLVYFLLNIGCVQKVEEHIIQTSNDQVSTKGMIFLQHHNPYFREGLCQHNLLGNTGYRLHNTGLIKHRFGEQWANSEVLDDAKQSGQPYYFDRITGGMPFQSLDGIDEIAKQLKNDPFFLGFQVHEWGNSPIHDYFRINSLLLDKGLSLDEHNFAAFEGRTKMPFFSGGDYRMYKNIYEPLHNLTDVDHYLEQYFRQIIDLTSGQVISVSGYIQLHHAALRLGAKNIMSEIGNQVPLTAFQIAFARGAARQYNKPFGVYYEPWVGDPFGCVCALDFTTWDPGTKNQKSLMGKYHIGQEYGSSRSLLRRLLFYSWLAGATYWSEEWGAENYFSNWEDYPLTDYGKIIRDFLTISNQYSRPKPVVPVALVMPTDIFGVDIRYIAGGTDNLYHNIASPDSFHVRLRVFAMDILAADQSQHGSEARNLTPSPWISSFDVLSAETTEEILQQYQFLVYFDKAQAEKSPISKERIQVYQGKKSDANYFIQVLDQLLPYHVKGNVGVAHARTDGRYLLGVFNNLGITKTMNGETADPNAGQSVNIQGSCKNVRFLTGKEYVTQVESGSIDLLIPAGKVVLISFPDDSENASGKIRDKSSH